MRMIALAAALAASGCMAVPSINAPSQAVMAEHFAFAAQDLDASIAFYKGAFGFRELQTPFDGDVVRWLDLGNGQELHIFRGGTGAQGDARERHLALTTDDIEPILAYLRANGIAWTDFERRPNAVQTRPDGVKQFFVRDPDGHWIEVNDAMKAQAAPDGR